MKTSEKVKSLIEEQGLSQLAFANLIGINKVTLSRNLKHDTFSHKTLLKIADTFGLDVNTLYPSREKSIPTVVGYLEYGGEIHKIKNLGDLLKATSTIEKVERFMKVKQVKLPAQSPIKIQDIVIDRYENYDASLVKIESFRHGDDVVEGREFTLGNMCSDFPFELNGIRFYNSESAYIAGIYSNDTEEHQRIQKELSQNTNGFQAKKEYRSNRYKGVFRADWETYNIEWMKYVVWSKCVSNPAFSELLKSVPEDTMIVENSTGMANLKSKVWGCHNDYLEELRDAKVEQYKLNHPHASKMDLNIERNRWNNYGVWDGKNVMGKILKMCSLCLKHNTKPPIDYDVLNGANIYLLGQKLNFIKPTLSAYKNVLFDMDFTLIDSAVIKPVIEKIKHCKDDVEKAQLWEEHDRLALSCKKYDGVDDLLTKLTQKGIGLGIVTNSVKRRIDILRKNFFPQIPLEHCVGRYSVNRYNPILKPNKEPYLKALELLNAKPEETLYLGNAANDIIGANNSGITSVACLWGATDTEKQAMIESKPDYIINTPGELLKILN